MSNPVKTNFYMTHFKGAHDGPNISENIQPNEKTWTDFKFAVSRFDLWWASNACWLICQRLMFICGLAKHAFMAGKLRY